MAKLQKVKPAGKGRVAAEADAPTIEVAAEPSTPLPEVRRGPMPMESIEALDGVRRSEQIRTELFFRFVLGLDFAILASLCLTGGDRIAKIVFAVSLLAYGAVTFPCWRALRAQRLPGSRLLLVSGCTGMTCAYVGLYYYGPFSLGLMVVVLALYFFSLAGSPSLTRTVYLVASAEHLVLAALLLSGVVPDVGLIRAHDMDLLDGVLVQGFALLVLFLTFSLASATASANRHVFAELELAHKRILARQEAVLLEAELELGRAAKVTGDGRFSGQTLGSFVLHDVIGRGATGEVYAASRGGQEGFAVKVLKLNMLSYGQALPRFQREGRILLALRSPHIVSAIEVSNGSDGIPFIGMRRVKGTDLAQALRDAPFSLEELRTMVAQVATGLACAHAKGIVHRDLKPQNIVRDDVDGLWKILDFGSAREQEEDSELTQGHIIGTPLYMAPEQASNAGIDRRADVYALGAVCYRACVGAPPFGGNGMAQILFSVVNNMPIRPTMQASVPKELDLVLAVALAKDPHDRFSDAEKFAEALGQATRGVVSPAIHRRALEVLKKHPWSEDGPYKPSRYVWQ